LFTEIGASIVEINPATDAIYREIGIFKRQIIVLLGVVYRYRRGKVIALTPKILLLHLGLGKETADVRVAN
jgi:hypothetical protein